MPYIQSEIRPLYDPHIRTVVGFLKTLNKENAASAFYAFSINLLYMWLEKQPCVQTQTDIDTFLMNTIEKMLVGFDDDYIAKSGHLNYMISSVAWALVNAHGYGFRSFIKGVLRDIESDPIFNRNRFKRWILKGLVSDICDEMYRRQTVPYENQKIADHGDVDIAAFIEDAAL